MPIDTFYALYDDTFGQGAADIALTRAAAHVFAKRRPSLTALHLLVADKVQHEFGPAVNALTMPSMLLSGLMLPMSVRDNLSFAALHPKRFAEIDHLVDARAPERDLYLTQVEGEVTELRRNDAWANVFLTLKDPKTGATLNVTIARRSFDRLELDLAEVAECGLALCELLRMVLEPRDDVRIAPGDEQHRGGDAPPAGVAGNRRLIGQRVQADRGVRLKRGDDHLLVQQVRRGDEDGLDPLVVEDLAQVLDPVDRHRRRAAR